MKTSAKARKKNWRRLKARTTSLDQTSEKLIQEVHSASEDQRIPEYLWPDITIEAAFHREGQVTEFVKTRGAFDDDIAWLALNAPEWEAKERVAAWLRKELKQLRRARVKPGEAPVRRRTALSELQISDIAVELLQRLGGNNLICLFQELLYVDRHRRALADQHVHSEAAAQIEAALQLQGSQIGVNKLSKLVSVAGSTVTRWRASERYPQRVEFFRGLWDRMLRQDYFDEIKASHPEASEAECFRLAFKIYVETVPQRQAALQAIVNRRERDRRLGRKRRRRPPKKSTTRN